MVRTLPAGLLCLVALYAIACAQIAGLGDFGPQLGGAGGRGGSSTGPGATGGGGGNLAGCIDILAGPPPCTPVARPTLLEGLVGAGVQFGITAAIDPASSELLVAASVDDDFDVVPLGSQVAAQFAGATGMALVRFDEEGTELAHLVVGSANNMLGTELVRATAVAFDSAGNAIVAGYYHGTADFGEGPTTAAGTMDDGFIAKYDSAFNVVWLHTFGGAANDRAWSVMVDPQDDSVWIGGMISGTDVDFPGEPPPGLAAQAEDGFVLRIESDGSIDTTIPHLWQITGADLQQVAEIAIDATHVYVAGSFQGLLRTWAFGRETAAVGALDLFVAKYDRAQADGPKETWMRHFGADSAVADTVRMKLAGNGVVVGTTVDAPIGDGIWTSQGYGMQDVLVLALQEGDGSDLWHTTVGGPDAEALGGLVVDHDGTVVVYGSFATALDQPPLTGGTGSDLFLAELDACGQPLGANRLSTTPPATAAGNLNLGPSCEYVVSGRFNGSITADGTQLNAVTGQEAFFLRHSW